MKQKLLKTMLLLSALIAGTSSVWAAETVYKTALFGSSYNSQGVSSYENSWYSTTSGFRVDIVNFNNNNNGWSLIKCGSKNAAYTGTITTHAAVDKAITKVALTIDAITVADVNSIKLYTSTDGSTWTEAGSFDKSTGAKEVALASPAADLYYKIEIPCIKDKNGVVTVSRVDYYYNAAEDLSTFAFATATPSVTLSKTGSTFDADFSQAVTVLPVAYDGTITYAFDEENSTFDLDDAIIDDETGEIAISTDANIAAAQTIVVKASGTATAKYNKPTDATYTLTVNPAPAGVGTPTFSQATGSYYYGTTFTISSANSTKIYYTTDGTTPSNSNGTLYSGAITITATVTVKAIGYDGETTSEVSSVTYTLKAPVAPTFSVAAGGVVEGTTVELGMGEGGTKVVYTTDGSTPTAGSTTYSSAITVNYPTTIKAATVDAGDNLSSIETRAYTIVVTKLSTLWSEEFDDYSADDVPSGGTYSYACSNGGGTTKIYEAALAGGSSPEILVAKSDGYFQATVPLDNVSGNLTLTYTTNNTNLTVSSTTDGVSLSGDTTPQGSAKTSTVTITGVTTAMKSLVIKFTNTTGSNCRLDDILLTCNKTFETEPVSVTAAGYATYVSTNALDFTGKSIEAYIATTKGTGTGVNFTRKYKIPANTGVLLYKSGGATVNVPVLDGAADAVTGNVFVPGADATVASEVGDYYNYILNNKNDKIGFYRANGQTVAANRAYIRILKSETPSPVKEFFTLPGMEDDATSIQNSKFEIQNEEAPIYNLAGQRIQKLQKGINIVNGKKIMVK